MIYYLPPPFNYLPPIISGMGSAAQYVSQKVKDADLFISTGLVKIKVHQWHPCFAGAGAVASLAAQCFSLDTTGFVHSSSFVTGGLSFSAFKIGFHLTQLGFNSNTVLGQCVASVGGVAATAAFAYLASVPIITAIAFSLLGVLGQHLFIKSIPWMRLGLEKVGLNPVQAFWVIGGIVMSVNLISSAATGSLMYTSTLRLLGFTYLKDPGVLSASIAMIVKVVGIPFAAYAVKEVVGSHWGAIATVFVLVSLDVCLTSNSNLSWAYYAETIGLVDQIFHMFITTNLWFFGCNSFHMHMAPIPAGVFGGGGAFAALAPAPPVV